jgi:predicted dehydrogenase
MRVLQIGLGSMGKRRIRNMQAIGVDEIVAYDLSDERRAAAEDQFGIATVADLTDELAATFDAMNVSTPPDKHLPYIQLGIRLRKPTFIEASVLSEGLLEAAQDAEAARVLVAPSCTLRFHPAIEKIKEIVTGGGYGKITNFTYVMGQYLPDWHPWEDISKFYVGKKETSGSREMVAFELTWLLDITGMPTGVCGFYGRTLEMGADIDDTYSFSLKFPDLVGAITCDVVARFATRSLFLNLERAQVRWNWEDRVVRLYDAKTKEWREFEFATGGAAAGYNANITEDMYVDEMRAFFDAVQGAGAFPNTLRDDVAILGVLEAVERSSEPLGWHEPAMRT